MVWQTIQKFPAAAAAAPWQTAASVATSGGGFKTKMCNFFQLGTCTKGEGCTYAHGAHELSAGGQRASAATSYATTSAYSAPAATGFGAAPQFSGQVKKKLCQFFELNSCTKGDQCQYAHGAHEIGTPAPQVAPTLIAWTPPNLGKGAGNGLGGKGGLGKGKGKGKSKRSPGHNLPRTRISAQPLTGTVLEWSGKFGWIQPTVPVEHEKAARHGGRIFVSVSDLIGIEALTPGSLCQFQIFEDVSGLGAEECYGS